METFSLIVVVAFFAIVWFICKPDKKERNSLAGQKLVKSCVILGTGMDLKSTTKTSNSSAIGRGIVGGALFGGVGAVIGASGAKKTTTTKEVDSGQRRFLVEYTDGTRNEEMVSVGTSRYNYLMSKVKM